jgi:magnesium-transporting ATPase (P-type)
MVHTRSGNGKFSERFAVSNKNGAVSLFLVTSVITKCKCWFLVYSFWQLHILNQSKNTNTHTLKDGLINLYLTLLSFESLTVVAIACTCSAIQFFIFFVFVFEEDRRGKPLL